MSDGDSLDYLEEYDASRGISFGAHLVAGSLAGLAEHSLIFPLDTIKTNAQCVGACGPTKKPPDVLCVRAARDLLMEGAASGAGAMRLWRGVGVVTIACVPAHAAYFGLFETVRESARVRTATGSSSEHSAGALADGLAGALAAVGHDLIMTPADVVKQRLQLGHHSGIVDCLRTVWAAGGWRTLYRSLPTTLAMNLPFGCVSVVANEWIKAQLTRASRTGEIGVASLLASGGAAGAVASLATTPFDVVKTRLQTQPLSAVRPCARRAVGELGSEAGARWRPEARAKSANIPSRPLSTVVSEPLVYRGFADAASAIWRIDGPRGFFRGATVRVLAQAPSVAIVWTTYELMVRFFQPIAS